jgi:Aerobic-type carbon monoxide dehydrogenase, large subunit CoxL/CutL homologs
MGKYVGQPIKRREDLPLIQGKGRYVDDIKADGVLYVGFVRSPHAHARIKSIDLSKAEKHPDAVGFLTPDEAVPMHSWMKHPGLRHPPRYSLAREKARFVGEPVVAVAARSRYSLDDVIELVEVEYEPLKPVVNAEEAMKPGAPLLYEEWGDNVIMHTRFKTGDVEAAFAKPT